MEGRCHLCHYTCHECSDDGPTNCTSCYQGDLSRLLDCILGMWFITVVCLHFFFFFSFFLLHLSLSLHVFYLPLRIPPTFRIPPSLLPSFSLSLSFSFSVAPADGFGVDRYLLEGECRDSCPEGHFPYHRQTQMSVCARRARRTAARVRPLRRVCVR